MIRTGHLIRAWGCICTLVIGAALFPSHSVGVASSSTVGATVLSSSWIDPALCATGQPNRTDFGSVTAGSSNVTTLDCEVKFGSSNDTSMLRLYQRDAGGVAMTAAPAAGLVGWWPLNGSVSDLAPTGNAGAFGANPADPVYAVGKPELGQSVDLDGDDTVIIPSNPAYDLTTFTVDLWFNIPVYTDGAFFASRRNGTDIQFDINFFGGDIVAGSTTNGPDVVVATPAAPLLGAWHHLALVADSTASPRRLSLYIDGVLVDSATTTDDIETTPGSGVRIGAGVSAPLGITGKLDELRIHDVARSASEIRSYAVGHVADYVNDGSADWDTPGSFHAFGACLRDALDGASGGGTAWTEDVNAGADCTDGDADPWNAIPSSAVTKVAFAAAIDAQGGASDPTARLRFGFRTRGDQAPGSYRAPLTFEVVAPNA